MIPRRVLRSRVKQKGASPWGFEIVTNPDRKTGESALEILKWTVEKRKMRGNDGGT